MTAYSAACDEPLDAPGAPLRNTLSLCYSVPAAPNAAASCVTFASVHPLLFSSCSVNCVESASRTSGRRSMRQVAGSDKNKTRCEAGCRITHIFILSLLAYNSSAGKWEPGHSGQHQGWRSLPQVPIKALKKASDARTCVKEAVVKADEEVRGGFAQEVRSKER